MFEKQVKSLSIVLRPFIRLGGGGGGGGGVTQQIDKKKNTRNKLTTKYTETSRRQKHEKTAELFCKIKVFIDPKNNCLIIK